MAECASSKAGGLTKGHRSPHTCTPSLDKGKLGRWPPLGPGSRHCRLLSLCSSSTHPVACPLKDYLVQAHSPRGSYSSTPTLLSRAWGPRGVLSGCGRWAHAVFMCTDGMDAGKDVCVCVYKCTCMCRWGTGMQTAGLCVCVWTTGMTDSVDVCKWCAYAQTACTQTLCTHMDSVCRLVHHAQNQGDKLKPGGWLALMTLNWNSETVLCLASPSIPPPPSSCSLLPSLSSSLSRTPPSIPSPFSPPLLSMAHIPPGTTDLSRLPSLTCSPLASPPSPPGCS